MDSPPKSSNEPIYTSAPNYYLSEMFFLSILLWELWRGPVSNLRGQTLSANAARIVTLGPMLFHSHDARMLIKPKNYASVNWTIWKMREDKVEIYQMAVLITWICLKFNRRGLRRTQIGKKKMRTSSRQHDRKLDEIWQNCVLSLALDRIVMAWPLISETYETQPNDPKGRYERTEAKSSWRITNVHIEDWCCASIVLIVTLE